MRCELSDSTQVLPLDFGIISRRHVDGPDAGDEAEPRSYPSGNKIEVIHAGDLERGRKRLAEWKSSV